MTRTFFAAAACALFAACPAYSDKPKAPAVEAPKAPPAKSNPAQTDPAAEDFAMPPLPMAKMKLKDSVGTWHAVDVEVAATPIARERGLMWRRELADGKGMLFIFAGEQDHWFWMKNTLIGLDMAFIGANKQIVGIVHAAEPQTTVPRGPGRPAMYVLELPSGYTEKIGVREGAPVEISGVDDIKVIP